MSSPGKYKSQNLESVRDEKESDKALPHKSIKEKKNIDHFAFSKIKLIGNM